jgi:hypothetical protein
MAEAPMFPTLPLHKCYLPASEGLTVAYFNVKRSSESELEECMQHNEVWLLGKYQLSVHPSLKTEVLYVSENSRFFLTAYESLRQ